MTWRERLRRQEFLIAIEVLPQDHEVREDADWEVLEALAFTFGDGPVSEGHLGVIVSRVVGVLLERWKE